MYRYGISIPIKVTIGGGFHITHFGNIVIHEKAVVGKNCSISHGVTLGIAHRGKHAGCPKVGDNVYIGPGAKVIGNVTIGDYAAIGANAVVTNDIPERGVAVGIPAKVISFAGSDGYINFADY